VGFYQSPQCDETSMLVMPYLRAPKDEAERDRFMEDGENSLLWKALKAFADKGRQHDDLEWRHVGIIVKRSTTSPPGAKKQKTQKEEIVTSTRTVNANATDDTFEQVFLLDLGSASDLLPKDVDEWVEKSFKKMKELRTRS
jgi:hypothetical protein